MTGVPLLIVFILAIILLVLSISKWKVHPFLAIMGISLILAILSGIDITKIADVIGTGFSSAFTSIGIVIILGAIIGILLDKTGAALKMADCVIKLVGEKHPEAAMLIMGWLVSIPVFCDSGFVVLNPIRKALVKRTGKSSVALTVALAFGLYISHCFIPPTPGPIAAANALFSGLPQETEADLLLVMGIGALCSILPMIAALIFSGFIGKKVAAKDEANYSSTVSKTYEQTVKSYGKLPNAWLAFAPIVIPILLMGLSCVFNMIGLSVPFIIFLGKPMISLSVGLLFGILLLALSGKISKMYDYTTKALKTCGPILFTTAAGGVLGMVIANSTLISLIKDNAAFMKTLGLFFPFFMAALLKTAQGSSTVAITTTAGIVAPLMSVLGWTTPVQAALLVVAIGAGSMVVCHANDSYFWVVTNLGEIEPQDGYKSITLGSLIVGLSAMLNVILVSLFI